MENTILNNFGVVIAVCQHDYHLAKACVASVKYFMPDVKICLICDGQFSTYEIENYCEIKILRKNDLKDSFLKEHGFGWGMTRLIAIWESPFEYSLILDADTIVWGDMRKYIFNENSFDCLADKPRYVHDTQAINKWFFNTVKIANLYPDFKWQFYRDSYFCPGVSFLKKNIFNINDYKNIVELAQSSVDLFFLGDMGYWNFFLFYNKQKEKVKVISKHLQTIVPDFQNDTLKSLYPFFDKKPVKPTEPTVLHYCGNNKVYLLTPFVYAKPANYFRKMFYKKLQLKSNFSIVIKLLIEDAGYFIRIYKGKFVKLKKKYSQI